MASQQLQRNSSRCPHSWTSCRAKDNCCVSTKLFVQVPEADWIIMAHQRCGLSCASDWHASLMINLRRYESCVCTGGMPRTTRLTCAKGPLLFEVTNRPHHTRLVSNASSRIIKPYPYKSPAMLCRKAVLAAIVLAALAICVDAAVDLPVATEVRGPWNYFPRRCRACTGIWSKLEATHSQISSVLTTDIVHGPKFGDAQCPHMLHALRAGCNGRAHSSGLLLLQGPCHMELRTTLVP